MGPGPMSMARGGGLVGVSASASGGRLTAVAAVGDHALHWAAAGAADGGIHVRVSNFHLEFLVMAVVFTFKLE